MSSNSSSSLSSLNLPPSLKQRITQVRSSSSASSSQTSPSPASFILYLPTVVLRKKHNPAFALACRLSNHHNLPLIILATVLDDNHMPSSPSTYPSSVVMTARRLAFTLEALSHASTEFTNHGAGVLIRVHAKGCRTPHHLSLARKAYTVVTDEPFVHPHLVYIQAVERVNINTYRVDGSCLVTPSTKIQRKFNADGKIESCRGLPEKAWKWDQLTQSDRKSTLVAVNDGHFDAPSLNVRLKADFFIGDVCDNVFGLPNDWCDVDTPSPGKRPWTSTELNSIPCLKSWSLNWAGSDASVLPVTQTHGSETDGLKRWSTFVNDHLNNYAKLRNQIVKPHAVSRMSCYLNLGIVSVFQCIDDLDKYRVRNKGNASLLASLSKFEEEILKWREHSYAQCYASEDYNSEKVVPVWAKRYLKTCLENENGGSYGFTLSSLAGGNTADKTWDSMQKYLVSTGELHNNARMTWGKTLLHWLKNHHCTASILEIMCYLNDRFALDGLSPPSYAGILYCLGGGGDKMGDNGTITTKHAKSYKTSAEGFETAKKALLKERPRASIASLLGNGGGGSSSSRKKQKVDGDGDDAKTPTAKKTMLSYFESTK